MKLSRRDFLALLAAAGSSACVGGTEAHRKTLELIGEWPDRLEEWTPTLCGECSGGCGLLARTVDKRVVGLLGNPFHPVNRGAICARGLGALQTVYDSARFTSPMIRRDGELVAVSWAEALALVAQHMKTVRQRGRPERVAVLVGDLPRLHEELWTRFVRVYGTPNLIRLSAYARSEATAAERIIYGALSPPGYGWSRSDLVLSFGTRLLDGGPASVQQHRQWFDLKRSGGHLVQIGSRLTPTAARADDWLAIAPGSDAAVALSLARLLLESGNYDPQIESIPGFAPWVDDTGAQQPGFSAWVRGRYDTAWCEEVSGAPAARIESLATQLAEAHAPLVVSDSGWLKHEGAIYSQFAFAALNLLIGAPGRKGSLASPGLPPITTTADPELDAVARAGLATPRIDGAGQGSMVLARHVPIELARRIASEDVSPIDLLFLDGVDPVSELPNGVALAEGLGRVGLVVALAQVPDATTEYADVILPTSHFLERFGEDIRSDEPELKIYSVAKPVLERRGDTRPAEEILAALAEQVGPPLAGVLPSSLRDAIYDRAAGLHDSGRGQIGMAPTLRQGQSKLRANPRRTRLPKSKRRFRKQLFDVGVWLEVEGESAPAGAASFAGPALESEILRGKANRLALGASLREPSGLWVPHYEGPLAESDDALIRPGSTLPLVTFETAGLGTSGSQAPWLQESLSPTSVGSWLTWVELNPRTAARLAIRHGQRVRLVSARGELAAHASLTETARPGFAYVPLGMGGVVSGGRGAGRNNVNSIIDAVPDPHRGAGIVDGTLLRIVPF